MRLKGKKPIFTIKDTYSLDSTLNPIIAAGLKKFLEVITNKNKDDSIYGVPGVFLALKTGDDGYEKDLEKASQKWFEALEKMIYSFGAEEPGISDGVVEMIYATEPNEEGGYELEIKIHNQDLYDKHLRDVEVHLKKVQEGLDLFAKHYSSLWW
jgi:hypothetical protein